MHRGCSRARPSVPFFFSSRRRHTRFDCDWSSDVCSSDLRADGEPRPAPGGQHHGHPQGDQRRARADARGQPAPARDGARLRLAHRRSPPGSRRVRWPALVDDTGRGRDDLRRRGAGVRRAPAVVFVAAVGLAWLAWDTGADPVRLARGLPWILDFVRRMVPPDLRVLPAALAGALTTAEIALLGTAGAAG